MNPMAPEGTLHGPIDMDDPHAVDAWSERLGVSRDELRAAAAIVGNDPHALRNHLGRPLTVTEIEPQDRGGEFDRDEG